MSLAAVKSRINALTRKLDAIQHPESNYAAVQVDPDGSEHVLWGDPTIDARTSFVWKFYEDHSFALEINGIAGQVCRV